MSTEFRAIRKKRTPDATSSNLSPEGDHRKRRRNRTTQSCLNCHTSKRMCDRKRPCGRCTQLGLTGLCVYEVDDPSQRSDAQDEGSRLRQRVAELEGVIRELKNKPHPRWAKSGSGPDEEFEKCHARARSPSPSEGSVAQARLQPDPSQVSSANLNADAIEGFLDKQTPSLLNEAPQSDYLSPSPSSAPGGNSVPLSTLPYSPSFDIHSPASVPSTGVVTPTDDHSHLSVAIADHQLNTDIDIASLFMSYPELLACDESPGHVDSALPVNVHSQHADPRSMKYNHGHFLDGHCGCLNEAGSYNVVLELSLRLRKAADILSHSAHHRFGSGCPLNRGIAELDAFATTALGNITTSPNDFGTMHLRSRANTAPSCPVPQAFSTTCVPTIRASAISPPSLRSLRPWNVAPCNSDPAVLCDESFMSWEPPRRG